jgi:hypothetical protein
LKLAHASARREIGEGRHAGDEVDGLGHAEQESQADERGEVERERVRGDDQGAQRRSADEHRPPPAAVGQAAGEGAEEERRHTERGGHQAETGLVGADRAADEERCDPDDEAGGREVRELRDRQGHEGRSEEAVGPCFHGVRIGPAVAWAHR